MPIWLIVTNDDKEHHILADVVHHDPVGNIYFSIRRGDEYTFTAAFVEWKTIQLLSLNDEQNLTQN